MKFFELAIFFDKLEKTSSRLELMDILSNLFKKTKIEDIDKVIYMSQGRVAPFFEPIELGMADKTVAGALAYVFGLERSYILSLYGELGDMGLVAQQLSRKNEVDGSILTVATVYNTLLKIAKTSGDGTVEKRIGLFSELVKGLDSISVKHLVRIVLGKTRLGIGDPTILDALAMGLLDDRGKRKRLEKAYNETSDMGLIGKSLLEGGLNALDHLTVKVGRPIRSELCERLPNPEKVFEKMSPREKVGPAIMGVHVTYKYDGFRCQIHKNDKEVRIFSRNLEEMTHMFPELINGVLKQVKAESAILDSEALAYQPESEEFLPFQETTKRRRKYNIAQVAEQLPLKAFVFDILYVDGKSLIETQLKERMEILREVVKGEEVLIPSAGVILKTPKDLQLMLDDAISKGLEGVVVKRIDSHYEAGGRNFNWVKLKRHSAGDLNDTIDCVILGYIYGRGKRAEFGAGALLVGVYDSQRDEFVTVTKIGTGLTDDEWRSIKEKAAGLELTHKPARVNSLIVPSVWVKPQIVIEVLADEITRSPIHTAGAIVNGQVKEPGYALRFPRLVSFRDNDKMPEDATTVKELIEMYSMQENKSGHKKRS